MVAMVDTQTTTTAQQGGDLVILLSRFCLCSPLLALHHTLLSFPALDLRPCITPTLYRQLRCQV